MQVPNMLALGLHVGLSLVYIHPYCVYASSEDCGESAEPSLLTDVISKSAGWPAGFDFFQSVW